MQMLSDYTKEFTKLFQTLCVSRSNWQLWADVITGIALAIANIAEKDSQRREEREKEFSGCEQRIGMDALVQLYVLIVKALDEDPEQDFLGKLYMDLGLGNHWKGQFFTPYSVCRMMANISVDAEHSIADIKKNGWIGVNDCACGAGATLIAAANELKRHDINYQQNAVFVAQDIDRITAMMCYIQLSLLGCAGYVVVADSLCNPIVGETLLPVIREGQEYWFTPMWYTERWETLRQIEIMRKAIHGGKQNELQS